MRAFDFNSWQGILSTVLGLAIITLVGVGVRLLAMYTIQQRRERENRQINERLRVLIAAYKSLGGSFTGNLAVDPTHLGDLRRAAPADPESADPDSPEGTGVGSERARRTRDAVEAALSDIILLGTDEHVRLAALAAQELVAGRTVHTAELVAALRDFIRAALALDPVPVDVVIPSQGPTRTASAGGRGRGEGAGDSARHGGGEGGRRSGAGGGGGAGLGVGMAAGQRDPDDRDPPG